MDEAAFDKMFAQQIQHLWVEYNQRESLAIRHAQEAGIAEILRSVLMPTAKQKAEPKLEATEAYDLIEEFFKNQRFGSMLKLSKKAFSTSYETNQLAQRIVAEVADVQLGIEAAQEPQQRLINLIAELYSGPKRLVLEDGEVKVVADEIPIPLESLSSGEKQVLQLLLECLAAGDNTLIIDEPELSMHVDWQKNLVKNLKTVNESGQLILATHSPEVMADLPDEVIIEL